MNSRAATIIISIIWSAGFALMVSLVMPPFAAIAVGVAAWVMVTRDLDQDPDADKCDEHGGCGGSA